MRRSILQVAVAGVALVMVMPVTVASAGDVSLTVAYEAGETARADAAAAQRAPHLQKWKAERRWARTTCLTQKRPYGNKKSRKKAKARLVAKCRAHAAEAEATYKRASQAIDAARRAADEVATQQLRRDIIAAMAANDAGYEDAQRLWFAEHEALSARDDAARAASYAEYLTCIEPYPTDGQARLVCLDAMDTRDAAISEAWQVESAAISERQRLRQKAADDAFVAHVGDTSYQCHLAIVTCHSLGR